MPRGLYPRQRVRSTAHDGDAALAPLPLPPPVVALEDNQKAPSAKVKHLVEAIRKPFRTFTTDFGDLVQGRAELAPAFVKALRAWQDETKGAVADFVRSLDSTVPVHHKEYRLHRSYVAADYLIRLVAQQERAAKQTGAKRKGAQPVTPMVALARLVATVLPSIDPKGAIFAAFVKEMHWSEAQVARLNALAAKTGPVKLHGRTASLLKIAA